MLILLELPQQFLLFICNLIEKGKKGNRKNVA